MKTERMTVAQALIRFLDSQYLKVDGEEIKFVDGVATIFGHGNVLGLGQALDQDNGSLHYYQGKNEQSMAHAATAFARQNNRHKIIAVSSSIGPGAANMVTAAALASVDNIPLLLLPGDTFATRQPDPVLQQLEQPGSLAVTTNDAFRPICKYWDRIERPEQLMTAMIHAMRVLTDPAETGAVCIALPQDVQGESYGYPDYFLKKRVHLVARPIPSDEELQEAVSAIEQSSRPLVICGGGVKYSGAGQALQTFCETFKIPLAETQAGKSAVPGSMALNLGGIGATGNLAANTIARDADCIIAVGSRLTDFTTSSKWLFGGSNVKIISVNISKYHAYKMDSISEVGDAKATIEALTAKLKIRNYQSKYTLEIIKAKEAWAQEMEILGSYEYNDHFKTMIDAQNPGSVEEFAKQTGSTVTQTSAICKIHDVIDKDSIIVGASGSLPGDLQRMWTTDTYNAYHMEYGYSCMGYEIAAALGVKLAEPDKEVYALCGDGSFYMLHSALVSSIQNRMKINILLFDNAGFGCINNLEMGKGVGNFGTEFRMREKDGNLSGHFLNTDFAKIAEGYGAVGYKVRSIKELEDALIDSKKQKKSTLIDIKVLPKTMTHDYSSWWHVGVASSYQNDEQKEAFEVSEKFRREARIY